MMTEYIFTFGFGQNYENCFYVIKAANPDDARTTMIERFGNKWAMQYDSRERAGVEKFNLREINLKGVHDESD